ncbi:hypothetical protein F1721_10765 [Saccharopolyspora hirsuta]|uniref:Uncharacterized protein n=1 Tax=Saccharopolyspora hirsuta TaxID=1837 RepID=A0A5M7BZZ5_SACHI|nr:hypothetical protein [Saccharopolyspora hirsuta]KAA5835252.1 hypothetical protein F1721_10765 [Saccharopolyspora hirsuta]
MLRAHRRRTRDPTTAEVAEADRQFAEWMRANLARAAEHFGVAVAGEPVFGWRLRSISAAVDSSEGRRWLRVVSEQPQWVHGDWWTGNADSNAVTGIRKPHVLDVVEREIPGVRRQRAELMTYTPADGARTPARYGPRSTFLWGGGASAAGSSLRSARTEGCVRRRPVRSCSKTGANRLGSRSRGGCG